MVAPVIPAASISTISANNNSSGSTNVTLSAAGNDRILVVAWVHSSQSVPVALPIEITLDAVGVNARLSTGEFKKQGIYLIAEESGFYSVVEIFFCMEADLPINTGTYTLDTILDVPPDRHNVQIFEVTGCPEQGYDTIAQNRDLVNALANTKFSYSILPHDPDCLIVDIWAMSLGGVIATYTSTEQQISAIETTTGGSVVSKFVQAVPALKVMEQEASQVIHRRSFALLSFSGLPEPVFPHPIISKGGISTMAFDDVTTGNAVINLTGSAPDKLVIVAFLGKGGTNPVVNIDDIILDPLGVNARLSTGEFALQGNIQVINEGGLYNVCAIYLCKGVDLPVLSGRYDVSYELDAPIQYGMAVALEISGCPDQAYDNIVQNFSAANIAGDTIFGDSITPVADDCLILDFWSMSHSEETFTTSNESNFALVYNRRGSVVCSQSDQQIAAPQSLTHQTTELSQRRAWTLLSFKGPGAVPPPITDGTRSEKQHNYYLANGATSPSYNDAAHEFLVAQGVPDTQTNDMWRVFLLGLGHTGTVQDMKFAFWDGIF